VLEGYQDGLLNEASFLSPDGFFNIIALYLGDVQ